MRKLEPEEIECRVAQVTSSGCSLLLYKTARVDRAILDEMYTPCGWQNDFKVIDGKMYGGIGVRIQDDNGHFEWVWKWDCGTESNTEAEKGQASDCFKRAGFKWGIGIELYSAPFIWYSCKTHQNQKGKWELDDKYIKFKVDEIGYADNGNINKLTIIDDKNNVVFKLGSKSKPKEVKQKETINNDIDIIEGLRATDTINNLNTYYYKYEKQVQDIKKFQAEYTAKAKELSKGGK